MIERPILFSGPMVKAILEGRKTQTRRVIAESEDLVELGPEGEFVFVHNPKCPGYCDYACASRGEINHGHVGYCPYGITGDRLWVRESMHRDEAGPWHYSADCESVLAAQKDASAMMIWVHHKEQDHCPSIFMPRWASRITLEIAKVRVERLQEINKHDVEAEGIGRYRREPGQEGGFPDGWQDLRPGYGGSVWVPSAYKDAFRVLWDSINAKRGFGWDENPWVWVVEFRRINQ